MTVQELRSQLKHAQRRLNDAVNDYEEMGHKCYVLQDGAFLPLAQYILGEGKCSKLLDTRRFMELRRERRGNVTLYRQVQNRRYDATDDFQVCLDLEAEIARAMKDAAHYRRELERLNA